MQTPVSKSGVEFEKGLPGVVAEELMEMLQKSQQVDAVT